jgi:hypothetical protein
MGFFKKKKKYGEYMTRGCTFCGSQATQKNENGVYVCHRHLEEKLAEIKCTCGSWLEQKSGKFGPYFNCLNCGNVSYFKAMEMKKIMGNYAEKVEERVEVKTFVKKEKPIKKERKEITITSRDVDYFD